MYARKWVKKNPLKVRARWFKWYKKVKKVRNKVKVDYNKKRRQKVRLLVLEKYSGSPPYCLCCYEKQIKFLSIDHINGGGKNHRQEVTGRAFYEWLVKKRKSPKQFQVLCYNCNMAKGFYKICPHQEKK